MSEPRKINSERISEALFNPRMLICIFTGFSSGLPLYFTFTMIPAWLKDENISLSTIGLFSLIGLPYTWKFLWSPIMDRLTPPFLGRRRGWMLMTQIGLLISMSFIGIFNPQLSIWSIAYLSAAVAFLSASQDIVLDAYRRELLPDLELGLGNSIHVNAYRIAGLVPGSLGLILADHIAWSAVFPIVAVFMLPGIVMTFLISEPYQSKKTKLPLSEFIIEPFKEFMNRLGWRRALLFLAFIFFYKLGDSMATALSTPFYMDLGFSKTDIGIIAKQAALWPSIIGGMIGGIIMIKIGINRALWLFGIVQMITIMGFAWLASAGAVLWILAAVISMEYLGVGLGTAAFVAFMAKSTHRDFTATQLALFTALAAVPRTFANALTGYMVNGYAHSTSNTLKSFLEFLHIPPLGLGWVHFFYLCTFLAIPGMLLLWVVAPWNEEEIKSIQKKS
jgi:PAT family beta-lactamase induction signal transducer AmpG